MPSPLKIELFTRYHSETPCKVCPKQSAAYPETPEPIPPKQSAAEDPARTVSRYHAGASRSSRAPSPHILHSMHGPVKPETVKPETVKPYAIQLRPIPTGTDRRTVPTESARNDRAEPEKLDTASPRRIFHCSPVRGLRSRFAAPLLPCKEVLSAGFLR